MQRDPADEEWAMREFRRRYERRPDARGPWTSWVIGALVAVGLVLSVVLSRCHG